MAPASPRAIEASQDVGPLMSRSTSLGTSILPITPATRPSSTAPSMTPFPSRSVCFRPDDPAPVFVRPELAVEVSFLGWEGGRLRHPAYAGLPRVL
jgi:hypothetical protein